MMRLFLALFLLACFTSEAFAFSLPRYSRTSKIIWRKNAGPVNSVVESNADAFAKKELISIDSDDELVVDLDALAAESASQTTKPLPDPFEKYEKVKVKPPREAPWFPFLLAPPALDGTYAGDVGFGMSKILRIFN
jgi:hypothetical protein